MWVDIPDSTIDVNSPQDVTLFDRMRDNMRALRVFPFQINIPEASTGSSTDVEIMRFPLRIPDLTIYTGQTKKLFGRIEAHTSVATTGQIALRDLTSTNQDGTVASLVSADTVYTSVNNPFSIDLPIVDAWKGTNRIIQVMAKVTTGTIFARLLDRVDWYMEA